MHIQIVNFNLKDRRSSSPRYRREYLAGITPNSKGPVAGPPAPYFGSEFAPDATDHQRYK